MPVQRVLRMTTLCDLAPSVKLGRKEAQWLTLLYLEAMCCVSAVTWCTGASMALHAGCWDPSGCSCMIPHTSANLRSDQLRASVPQLLVGIGVERRRVCGSLHEGAPSPAHSSLLSGAQRALKPFPCGPKACVVLQCH